MFKRFKKIVEESLASFLRDNSLSESEILDSVLRVARFDPETLSCTDFLLASQDYQEFVTMMVDFKENKQWETG